MKEQLIQEFNALEIPDMGEVKELYQNNGAFINLDYSLPNGQLVKFWDDDKTYYINQLEKKGSNRCYGLTADEKHLMVCEYGEGGADAKIIIFKCWN